jgi:hypothetical protein
MENKKKDLVTKILEMRDKEAKRAAKPFSTVMPMYDDKFESLWDVINAQFNWKSVRRAMISLRWNWTLDKENGLGGIPTVITLKVSAKQLLYKAYEQGIKDIKVGGGGFWAEYFDGGDLILTFEIDCQSSYIES